MDNSDKGLPLRIQTVSNFRMYLSEEAKKIYDTPKQSVVIEVEEKGVTYLRFSVYLSKVCFPTEKEVIPIENVRQMAATFNYLVKEDMIAYGMLAPAMILPLAMVPDEKGIIRPRALLLIYTYGSAKVAKIAKKRVDALPDSEKDTTVSKDMCWSDGELMTYPEMERIVLNEFLKNEAFVHEGALGNSDWSNLPKFNLLYS